jgi:hypothetical protein
MKIKKYVQQKIRRQVLFCGETFTKTGINHLLQTHLKQKIKENVQGFLVWALWLYR